MRAPGCIRKCGGRWGWPGRSVPGLWGAKRAGSVVGEVWMSEWDACATVLMDMAINHWGADRLNWWIVWFGIVVVWVYGRTQWGGYAAGVEVAMLPVEARLCCRWRRGYAAGEDAAVLPEETRLCCRWGRGCAAGVWWIVVGHNSAVAGGDAAVLPVGGVYWRYCLNSTRLSLFGGGAV
jgi:hypothetical protein